MIITPESIWTVFFILEVLILNKCLLFFFVTFHIGSYLHKYHDIIADISTYMNFYILLLLGVGISSKFNGNILSLIYKNIYNIFMQYNRKSMKLDTTIVFVLRGRSYEKIKRVIN